LATAEQARRLAEQTQSELAQSQRELKEAQRDAADARTEAIKTVCFCCSCECVSFTLFYQCV
jgi:hypothetical protein